MPSRREYDSIDAYLRHFDAYTSSIPDAERETAACEIRQHLESLVADFEAEGCPPARAAAKAVEKFGSVKNVSRRIVWEYWRKRTQLIRLWTGILSAWFTVAYGFVRVLDGTFMPGLQGWQFFVLASAFGGILGGLQAIPAPLSNKPANMLQRILYFASDIFTWSILVWLFASNAVDMRVSHGTPAASAKDVVWECAIVAATTGTACYLAAKLALRRTLKPPVGSKAN